MKKLYWVLSVVFLLATAFLAILGANEWLRLLSLPMALVSVGCAVRALNESNAQTLDFNENNTNQAPKQAAQYQYNGYQQAQPPMATPPAPTMPGGLTVAELAGGSLRGAANSMVTFAPAFAATPMTNWQFWRIAQSIEQIAKAAQTEEQLTLAGDFAVRYLPSMMQYLSACNAEGCPEGAAEVLADMATVCEQQQDALQAQQAVRFEGEYLKLRKDIESAPFRWR